MFVGNNAYEEAGGCVLRDRFQQDDGGWLQDPVLLDRLAGPKSFSIPPRSRWIDLACLPKCAAALPDTSISVASVAFRYKNYRCSGTERQQVMTLAAEEFIRRFLIHILPRGFHRIRHYGLLAGSARKDCLAQARATSWADGMVRARRHGDHHHVRQSHRRRRR